MPLDLVANTQHKGDESFSTAADVSCVGRLVNQFGQGRVYDERCRVSALEIRDMTRKLAGFSHRPFFYCGKLVEDELSVKKYWGVRNYEIAEFIFEPYSRLDLE